MLAAAPNTPDDSPGQVLVAALLAAAAFYWLLPRPRGRSVALGHIYRPGQRSWSHLVARRALRRPAPDTVGVVSVLAVLDRVRLASRAVFVTQRNPARGAIAFAFVVVSVCGLFLTLAAPFLAAASVVVYAGAVIVTFLFVLMLSQVHGPSDENDRSREPSTRKPGRLRLPRAGPVRPAAGLPAEPVPASRASLHAEERAALLCRSR